jgi:predicted nucleic acid-binding protein
VSFLPAYLDSSALLKLVLSERESAAVREELANWPDWVSSWLSAIECKRAVRRVGGNASVRARLDHVLATCTLLRFDEPALRLAETIGSPDLRSLDAIHLACALSIGDYPGAFVTYDGRLASAAREIGLNVLSPGG